jgi:hypothetical protein
MKKTSSAWFIPYDVRPGKQVERRIVLDTLQAAKAAGIKLEELGLIGMGGVRYIDFLLANKVVGIRQFTSLEHDENLLARCEFNKPFHDLEIYSGPASQFIAEVGFNNPCVIWFDFEQGISQDLSDDMIALSGAVKPGTFIYITATAELPEKLRKINGLPKRLEQLQQDIEPFGANLDASSLNPGNFPTFATQLVRAFLTFGFAGRSDGVFFPFLRINYKDSTWMATVGGYFGSQENVDKLREAFRGRCDFLKPSSDQFVYTIEQFNITDAERRLFDRAAIARRSRRSEKIALRKLGFRESILIQYSDLMRFIPRYFESVL